MIGLFSRFCTLIFLSLGLVLTFQISEDNLIKLMYSICFLFYETLMNVEIN